MKHMLIIFLTGLAIFSTVQGSDGSQTSSNSTSAVAATLKSPTKAVTSSNCKTGNCSPLSDQEVEQNRKELEDSKRFNGPRRPFKYGI